MRLNLGAGATRPQDNGWVNVDTLTALLTSMGEAGRGALESLQTEQNYIEHDLSVFPWPFGDGSAEGVLASHYLEHTDCLQAVQSLKECYRILQPGGVLRVSVPDASYFRSVNPEDCRDNWGRLFGEGDDVSENDTYMGVVLFFNEHKQTYTEDALWCQIRHAGFEAGRIARTQYQESAAGGVGAEMARLDNRKAFSIYLEAVK